MNRMDGMSMDLTAENIEQMKKLFPEAVTEGKIDFEVLKALLGGEIEKRQEYYKFTWNGKEEARAYARTRSMGTLRPCEAESSGKDGTPGNFDSENLYIEGDNLEVLKLLQGPYHKRVKMIYIDPPYNTGKDFVYPDNYRNPIGEYKALTGQTDDEGKATRANPETSGRYHTDWLNMMYPRLILACNLLTDDGVIFVSIDDSEQDNLKKLCNEVFGEENFVAAMIWQQGKKSSGNLIGVNHEYMLVYAKNRSVIDTPDLTFTQKKQGLEKIYNKYNQLKRLYGNDYGKIEDGLKLFYSNLPENDPAYPHRLYCLVDERGIYQSDNSAAPDKPETRSHRPLIHPITKKETAVPAMGWRFTDKTLDELVSKGYICFGEDETKIPRVKRYLREYEYELPPTVFYKPGAAASSELELLLNSKVFNNPKDRLEIQRILGFLTLNKKINEEAIILDFFSGSATTAHAVMQLNAEDGGNRKFIMVQLPEPCEEGTEAAKAGYKNICEIGKERIRRAAKKIKEELTTKDTKDTKKEEENSLFGEAKTLSCSSCVSWSKMDFGFKVFKLDTSNLVPWNPNAETLKDDLFKAVDNVLAGRTTGDLLYEILLKCNLPLTLPIEERKFGDNTVYVVGMGALAICLDKSIPQTIAEEIVKLRDEYAPIVPMQVVFRDNGFDDVSKTNALQILKQAGFEEKSIQTI